MQNLEDEDNESEPDDSEEENNEEVDSEDDDNGDLLDEFEHDDLDSTLDIRKSIDIIRRYSEEMQFHNEDVEPTIDDLQRPAENMQLTTENTQLTAENTQPFSDILHSPMEEIQSSPKEVQPLSGALAPTQVPHNSFINETQPSAAEQLPQECITQLSENLEESLVDIQTHSDNDDTLSVFSEHSYCQHPETLRNDSGFVDASEAEGEQMEENIEHLFTRVDNIVINHDEPLLIEEEYQRILHLLEESQKDMLNEQAGEISLYLYIFFCFGLIC